MAAKLKIKRSTQTNRQTHGQKDSRRTMTKQKQNQKNYTTQSERSNKEKKKMMKRRRRRRRLFSLINEIKARKEITQKATEK